MVEDKKQTDQVVINYIKKQEEKDRVVLDTLVKIQGNGVNNITINVYLDKYTLNLYDKKKQLYGARSALDFLNKTMKNAKPNNKLNWIGDPDILGQSASPLAYNGKGQYIVGVSPTQTKICDLIQVDKITNDIMANSVFKALNEVIVPATEDFSEIKEDERPDNYF